MKRTLIVLALFLVMYLLAHLSLERKEKRELKEEESKKVYSFEGDTISEISLKNEKGNFHFKKLDDNSWKIVEPQELDAQATVLNNLSGDISRIKIKKTIKDAQSPEVFGIGAGSTSFSFTTKDGKQFGFVVGDKSPDKSGSYFKKDNDPSIYIGETNLDDFKAKDLDEFREKLIFNKLKKDDIISFSLHNEHGKIKASFDADKKIWMLTEPAKHSAGEGVSSLISSITDLRAKSFIVDKATKADFKKYNLEKPLLSMSLDLKTKQTLSFDIAYDKKSKKEERKYYLRSSHKESIAEIEEHQFNNFTKSLKDLIDHKLGNFDTGKLTKIVLTEKDANTFTKEGSTWYGRTPVKFMVSEDKLNDLFNAIKMTNIARIESLKLEEKKEGTYGFKKPLFSIDLEDSENNKFGFTLGKENKNEVYVKKYNDDFVYTIKKDDAKKFMEFSVDNLREAKLIPIDRWNITEIRVPEKKIKFAKNKDSVWQKFVSEKLTEKESKSAEDFIDVIENLKVSTFSFNANLSPYEFDKGFTLHVLGKDNESAKVHFGRFEIDKAFVYREEERLVLEIPKTSYDDVAKFFAK